jgi:hypothetical protein
MKLRRLCFCFLCVLCASVVNAFSLNREAFTFTKYDLNVRVEPEQQRLGVRGKITLRNDSSIPQKIAVLQISSSLSWRSIKAGGKQLQFVSQPYTSDIDHTGALSEAVVTLPEAVPPKGIVDLEIAYEGVIVLDATRLTRIDTPDAIAHSTDWDQISTKFTAVRGVGYVTWYPIATDAGDISDGNELSQIVGRWKARHAATAMSIFFQSTVDEPILFSGNPNGFVVQTNEPIAKLAAFGILHMGPNVPTFIQANYRTVDVKGISTVSYLPGYDAAAQSYAEALANLDPIPTANGSRRLQVAQLPDPDASEFVSESMLLVPLKASTTEQDRLAMVYAVARGELLSPRSWVVEGLAHYAQAVDIERQHGRGAALTYLRTHDGMLVESEREHSPTKSSVGAEDKNATQEHSLINSTDELYVESKAMWVWWMLRDLLGGKDPGLLLLGYDPSDDKEPSYVQRLIEKKTQSDLEWFFDDWVYRDRGLPDFKVESAFTRKTLPEGYMLTITVANLGAAGAEVPLTVKFAGGEVSKRLVVRGKSNGVIRVEVPKPPVEIVVNDGSVPESDVTNNVFKIEASDTAK